MNRKLAHCLWTLLLIGEAVLGQEVNPAARSAPPELSLRTTRSIDFTTDEGTWISLDVSPDGRTLLFDLLGHLYQLPIEGGTAKAVTIGLSYNSQPRYSPDGKWIAFVSDRNGANNVWIARPDGSNARAITAEQHTLFTTPEWTRDGEYVLVSQKRPDLYKSTFEIWEYDVNGGSGIQVTKSNANDATPPTSGRMRSARAFRRMDATCSMPISLATSRRTLNSRCGS